MVDKKEHEALKIYWWQDLLTIISPNHKQPELLRNRLLSLLLHQD